MANNFVDIKAHISDKKLYIYNETSHSGRLKICEINNKAEHSRICSSIPSAVKVKLGK